MRTTAICVVAFILSACNGAGSVPPPNLATAADSAAQNGYDLLYVSAGKKLRIYSYPNRKYVGEVGGLTDPLGLCSSSTGEVFATDGNAQQIFEYSHGGTKPIATIEDSGAMPQGCSVDPTTGNLAVANACEFVNGKCNYPGDVAVYTGATGRPVTYSNNVILNPWFVGYDSSGNLFVAGKGGGSNYSLGELARGSGQFTVLNINDTIGLPTNVQYDGSFVTVSDAKLSEIHRYRIVSNEGQEVGPIPVRAVKRMGQTWIEDYKIFVPNDIGPNSGSVVIENYDPPTGKPKHVEGALVKPFGVTLSVDP
jgi:hypothetical protein